jgi:hypothetical protein
MATWDLNPLCGPDGQCPKDLADAIRDFQTFWLGKGVAAVAGVVEPGGRNSRIRPIDRASAASANFRRNLARRLEPACATVETRRPKNGCPCRA